MVLSSGKLCYNLIAFFKMECLGLGSLGTYCHGAFAGILVIVEVDGYINILGTEDAYSGTCLISLELDINGFFPI